MRVHLCTLILLFPFSHNAIQTYDVQDLSGVPKNVVESLQGRFPGAKVIKLTEEKEGHVIVYDFEFVMDGRKFEADVREDGSIHNWEKKIEASELPASAQKAAAARYPGSVIREVMQVTALDNEGEELEGYEMVLETVDKTEVEIMFSPEGNILEDSGNGVRP